MPVTLVEHLEFFGLAIALEARKESLSRCFHTFLAIGDQLPVGALAQAGENEVVVVVLPVVQVGVEVILTEYPVFRNAGKDVVAAHPFFDVAAHIEFSVFGQAGGFFVSGDAGGNRVAQGDDVFGIRPHGAVEKRTVVRCLGDFLRHDDAVIEQGGISEILFGIRKSIRDHFSSFEHTQAARACCTSKG